MSLRLVEDSRFNFSIPRIGMELNHAEDGVTFGYRAQRSEEGIRDYADLVEFTQSSKVAQRGRLPISDRNKFTFKIDDYGQLSYLEVDFGNGVTVGNVTEDWRGAPDPFEGFVKTPFPAGGPNEIFKSPLSYELDRNGLPVISSGWGDPVNFDVRESLWRFNPQTANWDRQFFPTATRVAGLNFLSEISFGFTPDNRLVHASINLPESSNIKRLSVLVEDPILGLQEIFNNPNVYASTGVSLAVSNAGEIAFAYMDIFGPNGPQLNVSFYDGQQVTTESVMEGLITYTLHEHSLAYDPEGNIALVHTLGEALNVLKPLILSRRDAAGVWTQTDLGIDAYYGELLFGPHGELYIGAVIDNAVVLLSDAIDPLLGDLNFDETVDLDDVLAFVQAIESPAGYADEYGFDPVFKGDLNGDGMFNLADVEPFVDELGLEGPAATALANLVPEPGTAGLFAAAVGLSGIRRSRGQRG